MMMMMMRESVLSERAAEAKQYNILDLTPSVHFIIISHSSSHPAEEEEEEEGKQEQEQQQARSKDTLTTTISHWSKVRPPPSCGLPTHWYFICALGWS
jgi:hypothetical protein